MLSEPAQKIINDYLHLPFPNKEVCCPYFINKKNKVRGALRALIGKGTPSEIVAEAQICALKEKINIFNLDAQNIRRFLVDHHLGIDCSGFVYHVIDAELKARKKNKLSQVLYFPQATNFLKKIIIKLRPTENTNVYTFADDKNSQVVPLAEVKTGDLVIITDAGKDHTYQHILLIHDVTSVENTPITLHYTHSIEFPVESWEEHGVRQGTITITDSTKPLLEQLWEERSKKGTESTIYNYALNARRVTLRRLYCLI